MNFRTEIEATHAPFGISHSDRIVLLGSCFTDSVGSRLDDDGFTTVHNPMGPLYNPASIARVVKRQAPYSIDDLYRDGSGIYHCMDYAARYSDADGDKLLSIINTRRSELQQRIEDATVVIITFGTARVYDFTPGGYVAGNCHRLPAALFNERLLSIEEIVDEWKPIVESLNKKVIFTLSPIRYTADGLARNSLSKAILRVAIEQLCSESGAVYFPAFEIMNDDLRDYRFYADDLKHPTAMAVEYIYQHFSRTFFSDATRAQAAECHRETMRNRHIPDIHQL
ncbi:MAG: GSCFA domain-containing protein [Muribaculaceae bacterium]